MKQLPPFVEKVQLEHINRNLARHAVVREAELANGGKGVALMYGKFPIILTGDEAMKIATGIADQLERNKGIK